MSEVEEHTINTLKILFDKVDTLGHIDIQDMLKPDRYSHYEDTLQEAYDALTTVEDALTSLGMKLEFEHWRLGGAVEELKPLMIQTRSSSDIMEAFEQRFSENVGRTITGNRMIPPSLEAQQKKEQRRKVLEAVRERRKEMFKRFQKKLRLFGQSLVFVGLFPACLLLAKAPMSKYITSGPTILSGMPVIVGTRMPVARILTLLKEGYLPEEIHTQFDHMSLKALQGALEEAATIINAPFGLPKVSSA